jgi:hypothetical protein
MVTHFQDANVRPNLTYRYRVRGVDVDGRHSEPTSPVTVACRTLDQSTLPVYSMTLHRQSRWFQEASLKEAVMSVSQ